MADVGVPLYEVLRDPGFFYPAALPGMAPQPLVTSRSKLMTAVTFWSAERREGSRRSSRGFPEWNRDTSDLIVIATGQTYPHGHSWPGGAGTWRLYSGWPRAPLQLLILLAGKRGVGKDTVGKDTDSAKLIN